MKIFTENINKNLMRLGYHTIFDLYDCKCDPDNLRELEKGKEFLKFLVKACNLNIIEFVWRQFPDINKAYTATVCLLESHIAIHTWSEYNFVSIDVFTCSKIFPIESNDLILNFYKPTKYKILGIPRGEFVYNKEYENISNTESSDLINKCSIQGGMYVVGS